MIHKIVRFCLHLFFPNRCPFCGECMPFGMHCCDSCRSVVENRKGVCRDERASDVFSFDWLVSPFCYEDEPSQAVKDLKFHETVSNAEHLSFYLWNDLMDNQLYQFDIIVPVPMTKSGQKKRGFNQAQKIAKELSYYSRRPVCSSALVKIRETKQQHTLTERQRRENLKGAFWVVRAHEISGKRVLLVDDVFTTGSTADECAKMLKKAGASCVIIGTICKVRYHLEETVK